LSAADARQSVAVLISGGGTNLRALAEQSLAANAPYRISLVLSDRPAAGGLAIARDLGLPARAVVRDKTLPRVEYDRSLAMVIDQCSPSLIVLAGFMRILSPEFVERYAGRILNIHPSLLPKYPGLHTHRSVLAAHDEVHGATVHFVTAELDGGPPILQARVPVEPSDDEASLAARVLVQEHKIYPLAVRWYCEGRLRCHDGRAWLDGAALTAPLLYDDQDPRPIISHPRAAQ
jgi:phosphoribosylglycinamide formyltransferase 1